MLLSDDGNDLETYKDSPTAVNYDDNNHLHYCALLLMYSVKLCYSTIYMDQ